MGVVVVGGHTRNIGKTSVVAGLISAMPERAWTAIKITQFGHGVCSANGEPCDCETADHTIAITEERDRDSGTDSSRYLAAGARKSFWVRTRQGQLAEAMPHVRKIIASAEHLIIESNSVLRFLHPAVSLSVLDPGAKDFKPSALRYLDRVDAIVTPMSALPLIWDGVSARLLRGKPHFAFDAPEYCSEALVEFVAQKLDRATTSVRADRTSELLCELS